MSKLINQSRLQQFATKLWDKIKGRYDDAFINAEITESTADEKKLKFTKIKGGDKVEVNLKDYARLQDRNEFKKDVSVDDADFYNNASLGSVTGTVDPTRRTLGARNLTSKMFTDGFVSTLRIHLDNSHAGNSFLVHLWEIKKGENKEADRTISKLKDGESFTITQVGDKKYVDIAINKKYTEDTYFLFRSSNRAVVKAISNIPSDKANDVMNLVDTTPPTEADQPLDLNRQNQTETAYVEIFGRIGIVDLSKKLKEVEDASGTYVKHSECTVQGGQATYAGKVVKLGADGKLDNSLMPKIALNEYYEVTEFTHAALGGITYENGDVVVVNNAGNPNNGKRYLCIKKDKNTNDLTEGFVELNSKDGVVTSVNDLRGAINLDLVAEVEKIKLNIASGSQTVTKELPIITTDEIDAIITALPN